MDYEQKYKEALGWMQSLYKGLHGATKEDAEHYFPELKEGEDERIRKEIIDFLGMPHPQFVGKRDHEKWIAWLEKQGEQHSPIDANKMVDEFANTEVKGYGIPSMIEVDAYRKGIEDALEKQGEQTQFDYEHADIPQKDFAPIEPKFKVGDWLQYRYAEPFLVEEITEQGYCNGNSCLPFECEDEIHLWTIQDAKDGDVLCYKDEISLYKHNIINCTKQETTFGGFVYHCCYDGKRFITDSLYSLTEQDKIDIYPSTKKQRDLLFEKMKKAGYEWRQEEKKK